MTDNHSDANHLIQRSSQSTIGSLFHWRAIANPDRIAVTDPDSSLTFKELDIRTNRLANYLIAQGATQGSRIGILAENRIEYLEVEIAAAKAGLIVAALNWRLAERELTHCINLVEPQTILVSAAMRKQLTDLDIPDIPVLPFGSDYESAIATSADTYPDLDIDPESGLIILYTSGTTGLPKGALISHRAMIARASTLASELSIPADDTYCAWPPLYHMASTDQSLANLIRGGAVHVVDGYQPEAMIDFLEAKHTALFLLMPGMVREFINALRSRNAIIKGVSVCGAMADLVPAADIAEVTAILNAPYLNSFGSTETGFPPASSGLLKVGVAPASLSKKQSAFCELRLVDEDDHNVPVGTPGEVALRGPTLFSGYWQANATNAQDFRNGWFHMGDVMRRNADGSLDYVDRRKYMIKSGGENIYPAEIETVLQEDPRISEAIVVRSKDDKWGEVPVAFVVPAQASDINETHISEICRSRLSSYKRPKQIFLIADDELPRSTTGKIQRHILESKLS